MELTTTQQGNVTVIAIKGNLMGGPDATALNTKVHELIDSGRRNIVVDLGGVEFMNSSGLGLLIGSLTALRNAGGGLKVAQASEKITALLRISKLSSFFEQFSSVAEAVESFRR